jgi:hypothetical protein
LESSKDEDGIQEPDKILFTEGEPLCTSEPQCQKPNETSLKVAKEDSVTDEALLTRTVRESKEMDCPMPNKILETTCRDYSESSESDEPNLYDLMKLKKFLGDGHQQFEEKSNIAMRRISDSSQYDEVCSGISISRKTRWDHGSSSWKESNKIYSEKKYQESSSRNYAAKLKNSKKNHVETNTTFAQKGKPKQVSTRKFENLMNFKRDQVLRKYERFAVNHRNDKDSQPPWARHFYDHQRRVSGRNHKTNESFIEKPSPSSSSIRNHPVFQSNRDNPTTSVGTSIKDKGRVRRVDLYPYKKNKANILPLSQVWESLPATLTNTAQQSILHSCNLFNMNIPAASEIQYQFDANVESAVKTLPSEPTIPPPQPTVAEVAHTENETYLEDPRLKRRRERALLLLTGSTEGHANSN